MARAKKAVDPYAVFDEHQIQCALMRAYKLRRKPRTMLFAVPNGMKRDKITSKRLKDEGCRPGATDLIAVVEGVVYFIEVKVIDGDLTNDQPEFHEEMIEAQGNICTVHGYIEAVNYFEEIRLIRPPIVVVM